MQPSYIYTIYIQIYFPVKQRIVCNGKCDQVSHVSNVFHLFYMKPKKKDHCFTVEANLFQIFH